MASRLQSSKPQCMLGLCPRNPWLQKNGGSEALRGSGQWSLHRSKASIGWSIDNASLDANLCSYSRGQWEPGTEYLPRPLSGLKEVG